MRESREESINRVLKLIDSCQRGSQVFRVAAENSLNRVFQQFAERMMKKFDQFGFELQTELRRLGGVDSPRTSKTGPPTDCESLLKTTMTYYQDALNHKTTAHARAMLTRQHIEIQQGLKEFLAHRAA
jgi:hypothetical protein